MRKGVLGSLLAVLALFSPLRGEEEFTLRLNEEEKAIIYEIISEMGERSLVMLFFKQTHMNQLGDSVRHVPPLQFLGFVLTEEHLRACLRKISKHAIKWSYFIEGFGKNMEEEFYRGRIFQDLPGFAMLVDRNYEKLYHFSSQHAWDQFVREAL